MCAASSGQSSCRLLDKEDVPLALHVPAIAGLNGLPALGSSAKVAYRGGEGAVVQAMGGNWLVEVGLLWKRQC